MNVEELKQKLTACNDEDTLIDLLALFAVRNAKDVQQLFGIIEKAAEATQSCNSFFIRGRKPFIRAVGERACELMCKEMAEAGMAVETKPGMYRALDS